MQISCLVCVFKWGHVALKEPLVSRTSRCNVPFIENLKSIYGTWKISGFLTFSDEIAHRFLYYRVYRRSDRINVHFVCVIAMHCEAIRSTYVPFIENLNSICGAWKISGFLTFSDEISDRFLYYRVHRRSDRINVHFVCVIAMHCEAIRSTYVQPGAVRWYCTHSW